MDLEEAKELGAAGEIFDIEISEIPAEFWSLQGIDFDASAAKSGARHYCHIELHPVPKTPS